eukprot:176886_1
MATMFSPPTTRSKARQHQKVVMETNPNAELDNHISPMKEDRRSKSKSPFGEIEKDELNYDADVSVQNSPGQSSASDVPLSSAESGSDSNPELEESSSDESYSPGESDSEVGSGSESDVEGTLADVKDDLRFLKEDIDYSSPLTCSEYTRALARVLCKFARFVAWAAAFTIVTLFAIGSALRFWPELESTAEWMCGGCPMLLRTWGSARTTSVQLAQAFFTADPWAIAEGMTQKVSAFFGKN